MFTRSAWAIAAAVTLAAGSGWAASIGLYAQADWAQIKKRYE